MADLTPTEGEISREYSWPVSTPVAEAFTKEVRRQAKVRGTRTRLVKNQLSYTLTAVGAPHVVQGVMMAVSSAVGRGSAKRGQPSADPMYVSRFFEGGGV